jgi:serine/threonine protein kinase/tetratricopeptide (TPR) repeat protein
MTPEEPTHVSGGAPQQPLPAAPRPAHPERIGPYRIVRLLGQGGMGTVYEAEQLEPLRRTVALKVIRRGMDSAEVLARFESERQALAVMDHPNIARALEAGTTDEGLPYFVMELVAGEPITGYCDRHGLDLRHRLQLFLDVCRGVQHAHQKGVIHRDLKPSNILVRVVDGQPVPTIIDFGIAKAVEPTADDAAFTTELGVLVGTPAYMSPEQAEASKLDIDTRADIYSLGMVLYELVTGVLPFDYKGLLPARFIAQFVLGTTDMPTPSRRVAGLEADTASSAAQRRRTTPVGLRRELRGDLDWIVVKAVERDRNRRYETANTLALDIERHLEHKPIVARPPTLAYTTSRFVRRHRAGVAAAVVTAVGLAVLVTGIARERTRAELEAAKAQAISTFLEDMLESADPWQGGGERTTVAAALRAGVARVNDGTVPDPVVAASIRRTIGSAYFGLGRNAEADTLFRAALAERIARTGPASGETAQSWSDLGQLYWTVGNYDSAGTAFERALEIRRRAFGERDTLVAHSLLDLADLANTMGAYGRADSLGRVALGILQGAHGDRHVSLTVAMQRIAGTALNDSRLAEADSITQASMAMLRDLGLGRSPQMSSALNNLAWVRLFQGRKAEAVPLMLQAVKLDSVLLGPNHPILANHLENLGIMYDDSGMRERSRPILRQVLALRRAGLPDDDPMIGRGLFNLAQAEHMAGDYASADTLYAQALPRMQRAYGIEHTDVVYATASLGRNDYFLGRRAAAERNLRWALGVTDPDGRLSARSYVKVAPTLVSLLTEQRRYPEAEPFALRVLAIRDSLKDTLARKAAAQVVELYRGWGRMDRAVEYERAR